MNITLIGAGNMGIAFSKRLAAAGHTVRVTSRDLAKAQSLASAYPNVTAAAPADALGNSQVVIVATSYPDAVSALQAMGPLNDRIVVDITNPLTADYMGLTLGFETSAAEEIQKALPGALVVKAFNTVLAQVLAEGPAFANSQTVPVFFAGDDERAKQTVRALVESIGFKAIDAGGLKNARYLEPMAGLNIYFAYGAGQGTQIAPTWIHRA